MTQRKDDPRNDPLLATCRALWEAVERFDEAACRALGLGRTDLRALNLLEHGPLNAGEIGARLGLTSGSVTALVERLLEAGYVSRHHPPQDRRQVLVQLEPPTFAAFAAVYEPLGMRVGAAAAALSTTQRQAAEEALSALAAAFDAQHDVLAAAGPTT